MSNTITARRERAAFYRSNVEETTLYMVTILQSLFDRTTTAQNVQQRVVSMRDDLEVEAKFKEAMQTQYPDFTHDFTESVVQYRSLMFLDCKQTVKSTCVFLHVFQKFLEFAYTQPTLLVSGCMDEAFLQWKGHWVVVINAYLQRRLDDGQECLMTAEDGSRSLQV